MDEKELSKFSSEELQEMNKVYEMWKNGEITNIDTDDPRTYRYLGLTDLQAVFLQKMMSEQLNPQT